MNKKFLSFFLISHLSFLISAQAQQPDTPPFGNTAQDLQQAWQRSCQQWEKTKFQKDPTTLLLRSDKRFGTIGTWKALCDKSQTLPPEKLLTFFNENFTKHSVTPQKNGEINGFTKFTGYYKPIIKGSTTPTKKFSTPLVAMPKYLPTPRPTRETIEKSIRKGDKTYKPLVWLDPVEAYFLHIQGGGTIMLPKGKVMHVGFAGKNGHTYTAIGKYMKEKGYLSGTISADRIKRWLRQNPSKLDEVMFSNKSFIFFRTMPTESPGAMGIPLTSGRSLAVDTDHFPLGVPLYVRTHNNHDDEPWRRLMFAQDIGSAIKGSVRGDIYFGHGQAAGERASDQNSPGQLLALFPKTTSPTTP